ncbi:ATP-binding protein [Candidatus Accumulibacter sp. ACC003]|uniref:ATP-binding protein n=1 Tax=Candidatus Accumulibacter sp. ACC003 TaxID=2823334 RepID=UPI0025BB5939|nr:ATP-binding protein [Candidatus Accumulibacter sp. ACC003]
MSRTLQAQAFFAGAANPLRRLVALRRFEVLTQAVVLVLAVAWLKMPLEVVPMAAIVALLAAVNLLTQWRLEGGRPVRENEVFAHLLIDVGALAVLLYFAGGSANPFVSLFLLPPILAAAMLPARHAWAMTASTLAAYTFLVFWKLPLPAPLGDLAQFDALLARATGDATEHAGHGSGFALHVLGMWLNFVISVVVVAFFLTRMAAALKERERELASAREVVLRDEQILSLGTLAASAAHQLGTPLATMAVVIRELQLNHGEQQELQEDLQVLRGQVDRCKQTIAQILASTDHSRAENRRAVALDSYLQQLLDEWQLIRPQALLGVLLQGEQPAPLIVTDRTLAHAILNLLDNAADANGGNGEALRFTACWTLETCQIEILDRGPGLNAEAQRRLGEAFFTTKSEHPERSTGLGIGLFLSNATIERCGGKVELFNRDDPRGGVCTRVTLPLARLKA